MSLPALAPRFDELERFARRHELHCERMVIDADLEAFALTGDLLDRDGEAVRLCALIIAGREDAENGGVAFLGVAPQLEVAVLGRGLAG